MKQSGFWDSAPVGGAARTQNGKEAEERRTGEERQGPGKRNRRGRVRKEESQRQEEGGGRCDELVRMVESVRDIDGRGMENDY